MHRIDARGVYYIFRFLGGVYTMGRLKEGGVYYTFVSFFLFEKCLYEGGV